jgi:hypothetical protein
MLQKDENKMRDKLLFELKLIKVFSQKLETDDYFKGQTVRKAIYPFIHKITEMIIIQSGKHEDLNSKLMSAEFVDHWKVLLRE